MHTQVCVVGTVATDPKLTKSAGRVAFCSFRLACNERRFDAEKKEWIDSDTNWYTINSFRGLAEHTVGSFHKGDRVIVNGRLRVRDWETEERSGTSAVVEADALGHDLRWGTTVFTRVAVAQPVEAAEPLSDAVGNTGAIMEPGEAEAAEAVETAQAAEGALATAGLATAPGGVATDDRFEADGFTPKPEYTAA